MRKGKAVKTVETTREKSQSACQEKGVVLTRFSDYSISRGRKFFEF
jgi:hypothetical protein